jgi:hypothetical protein
MGESAGLGDSGFHPELSPFLKTEAPLRLFKGAC